MERKNPYPNGKAYELLYALLAGNRIDFHEAYMRFNLPTINARVSELRKLGWPINSIDLPHPVLENEMVVAYGMDVHFLTWWGGPGLKHPLDYKPQAGRGKFVTV